jgi:hypothetical protein
MSAAVESLDTSSVSSSVLSDTRKRPRKYSKVNLARIMSRANAIEQQLSLGPTSTTTTTTSTRGNVEDILRAVHAREQAIKIARTRHYNNPLVQAYAQRVVTPPPSVSPVKTDTTTSSTSKILCSILCCSRRLRIVQDLDQS